MAPYFERTDSLSRLSYEFHTGNFYLVDDTKSNYKQVSDLYSFDDVFVYYKLFD